ncbi:hypothetical protein FHS43_000400 [Streptosporangium becharense]|uniref:DUF4097 domain-containing protein n=1 Tax=Streptosporangium becharense TaxID=1816182 RepID=A0A7W9IFL5_9ACTN|nr:DUF4097 family beta strand repeat-containing protein [Streptosporangium becharense]MBB2909154.1 hypothetical protein [Streptosporangium becharense]MBB5819827.1 hypothetical protein [Streptosporangium becharense]
MSTTERTLSAPMPGPVVVDLTMPSGLIEVTVGDVDRAEITLTSDAPTDSPAARAIAAATLSADARVVTVGVPTPEHDSVTVISGTRGGRIVVSGTTTSGIIVSGGTVHISGTILSAGNHVAAVSSAALTPGVRVTVRLPRGCALRIDTRSAHVTTRGDLEWIDFVSVSGDLTAQACGKLTASTSSGDVRAEFADGAVVRTISGDIRLGRTETAILSATSGDITIGDFGGSARLRTVSGDITVHATEPGQVSASATSGDITVTAPADLAAGTGENALTVDARSVTGDVRIPRPPSAPARPRRPRRGGSPL